MIIVDVQPIASEVMNPCEPHDNMAHHDLFSSVNRKATTFGVSIVSTALRSRARGPPHVC
jgi:hypothetical protein